MIETKKKEFENLILPDYSDKIQLISEKHKMLLSDLIQSPDLKTSLTDIEKRPGLLNNSLLSYDLEKKIKDTLPKSNNEVKSE